MLSYKKYRRSKDIAHNSQQYQDKPPSRKGRKHESESNKWKELTNAVISCLVKNMILIYSVEKKGFQRMLRTFDSEYDLPGCKYFT